MRIITGSKRGKKLVTLEGEQVRPTTDRVRETLFNWLAPVIVDAQCLDCFAGSGALGLEALSRYAAGATLIEMDRREHTDHVRVLYGFLSCERRPTQTAALLHMHRNSHIGLGTGTAGRPAPPLWRSAAPRGPHPPGRLRSDPGCRRPAAPSEPWPPPGWRGATPPAPPCT